MAQKILITGSCGFVMSNFVIYALQHTQWDLVSIDRITENGAQYNISHNSTVHNKRHKLYVGDICDTHIVNRVFELEKPDIVIHGAVERSNGVLADDNRVCLNTNIIGTNNILNAARDIHTPKRIINISDYCVYGNVEQGYPSEFRNLSPSNVFACSKASSDMLGQSYYKSFGLPIITVRPSNIFGPRQSTEEFIPSVISSILSSKHFTLYGNGDRLRDWMYVKDFFTALVKIIDNGVIGEIYNVGTGIERRYADILPMICKLLGRGDELRLSADNIFGADNRHALNCKKLQDLGWQSVYEFDKALAHTIGWYKANWWSWRK